MPTRKNPKHVDAIEQAAKELLQAVKPVAQDAVLLQEWPELTTAIVKLATALGLDSPMPSPSATQPIATSPIFDGSGRHIGYWRLCQQCRCNLPDTAAGGAYKAHGAVFCSTTCMDCWMEEHPQHRARG